MGITGRPGEWRCGGAVVKGMDWRACGSMLDQFLHRVVLFPSSTSVSFSHVLHVNEHQQANRESLQTAEGNSVMNWHSTRKTYNT